MAKIPSFEDYLKSLSRVTAHVDPTTETHESLAIKTLTADVCSLDPLDAYSVTKWLDANPNGAPILGLTVGLSIEKLRNALRQHLGSAYWTGLVRKGMATEIVQMLDREFDLLRSLEAQRSRTYTFGDILVARAGSRVTAASAATSGRILEDRIEAIAKDLGLDCATRDRFEGRSGRTAPCDLAVPGAGKKASIVVAAKAFDSTGSKLTDAVREVEEMAAVRKPNQFVMAVIDGIGWNLRQNDLRRIHSLWAAGEIDGMYTLNSLDQFRLDLENAAKLRNLL